MPSDQSLTASQFDEDGFPIAIGFQPGVDDVVEEAEAAQLDSELAEAEVADPPAPLIGYELVADMMRRQDEVLEQLDDLNARVEFAIEQISADRKSEIEALEADGQKLDADYQTNQQKAA